MTERDYDRIAKVLHSHHNRTPMTVEGIMDSLIKEFKKDVNFQPWKFHMIVIGERFEERMTERTV